MKIAGLLFRLKWLIIVITIIFHIIPLHAHAGVNPGVKFLFLNGTRRSFPLPVTNPAAKAVEVSVSVIFGYVVSNDSGQASMVYDTVGTPPQSAAGWLKIYPKRFILGPLENQVIRLVADPPPGIPDGEYWARLWLKSQPVKTQLELQGKTKTGVVFAEQVGLPFHYRKGNVTTGLDIQQFNAEASENAIQVTMDMVRKGNASYWGTAIFRLFNSERRRVLEDTSNVVVYTKYKTTYHLDRKGIPPCEYTLEVELKNEGRRDVRKADMVQSPPIRLTKALTIN